jgi:hypothetical protein
MYVHAPQEGVHGVLFILSGVEKIFLIYGNFRKGVWKTRVGNLVYSRRWCLTIAKQETLAVGRRRYFWRSVLVCAMSKVTCMVPKTARTKKHVLSAKPPKARPASQAPKGP